MSIPEELRPSKPARVMDLVAAAGLDVSDWGNYAKGQRLAAANPRYCYNWAFTEPGKQVLLFLWYDEIREVDDQIVQHLNYRQYGASLPKSSARAAWAKRSLEVDAACDIAFRQGLPVRVVVVAGMMRDAVTGPTTSSTVNWRLLDAVPWSATSYDSRTGACVLVRGSQPSRTVDQFDDPALEKPMLYRTVNGEVRVRDAAVRLAVLGRAKGYCELCGQPGFLTAAGAAYLETHHIVPLSEDGHDSSSNVIALCPNDHRMAHYSHDRNSMRAHLNLLLASKLSLAK